MNRNGSITNFIDILVMIIDALVPTIYLLIGFWLASSDHIFTNNELVAFVFMCASGVIHEIRKAKDER